MIERINWVDYVKFIGIFLVVLGHTDIPSELKVVIYSFHMPLFFFISGYLFNYDKYNSFAQFFNHRIKQLIVPYIYMNLITYMFWLLIGRNFGSDVSMDIPFYKPLIGIFYGINKDGYLIHCIPIWFLPCLFCVEMLCYIAYNNINKVYFVIISCITSIIIAKLSVNLPFSFTTALVAVSFYIAGNKLKDRINFIKPGHILLLLPLLAILIFLSLLNGRVDMSLNTYNNYFLFFLNSFLGILVIVILSVFLSNYFGSNTLIKLYSINTILILSFHLIFSGLIKRIILILLKVPLLVYINSIIYNVALTSLIFLFLIPIIKMINKYLPFLVGRKVKFLS